MNNKTNWLAIVASVVASMALGFLWYGTIFHNQWMAGNGITMSEDGLKMFKNGAEMEMSSMPMIVNTIFIAIYALIINWLINKTGMQGWQNGLVVGLAVGVTHALNVIVGNMFAGNPSSLSMVDGSYSLVMFAIIGAIIGGMQKK